MLSIDIDRFLSLVIYAILIGAKCFSIIGAMLSDPKAFELLVESIARLTFSSVNCMLVGGSFWRCLRNLLLSLLTVVGCDVNYLLNWFVTFFLSDVIVPSNEIAALLSCVFLLVRLFIVRHWLFAPLTNSSPFCSYVVPHHMSWYVDRLD